MKRFFALLAVVVFTIVSLTYPGYKSTVLAEETIQQQGQTDKIPAFPGAEGGGKWVTGGRGGRVIEVTNLNDSGAGSFREAVNATGPRIVVFRVSGTIKLNSDITVKNPDITIAGQTAPGDGICLEGASFGINTSNVIVRYIRTRMGTGGGEADAGGINGSNVIVDHCTFSWSVDETFSVYGSDITVQWSIISESMMYSVHSKGVHGYGGIWGGTNVTYHHNLLAQHSSRNPRFGVGDSNNDGTGKIDYANNVIYNWGFNSAYGADGEYLINMVNNYYKPGPDTVDGVKSRVYDTINSKARFYISGNYVEGSSEVTEDNWKGVNKVADPQSKLAQPVVMQDPVAIQSAEDAYKSVLESAGASLPKRDAADARVIADVVNGTGRNIDDAAEVGGWPELKSTEPLADTDKDGMTDDWEKANGLDPQNPEDRNNKGADGYTNVEKYINSITTNGTASPVIKIKSPVMNKVLETGSSLNIESEASDNDGQIAKVEFFDGTEKLGEATVKPYSYKLEDIKEGAHYISAVATDSSGTKTQSSVIRIFVNDRTPITPWVSQDIGETRIQGAAVLKDNVLSIRGNGKIGGTTDSFHYAYQKLSGDGEISALVKSTTPNPIEAITGMMIRGSLNESASMVYIGISHEKTRSKRVVFGSRKTDGENAKGKSDEIGFTAITLKLVREGNKITAYYSQAPNKWKEIGSAECDMQKNVYIGFVTESSQRPDKEVYNYSKGDFADISYTGDVTKAPDPQNKTGFGKLFGNIDSRKAIGGIAVIVVVAAAAIVAILKRRKH